MPADAHIVILPYPPSANRLYRAGRHKVLLSKEGRDYYDAVAGLATQRAPLTGRLRVWVSLFQPDKRRRDIDNTLKALCDALKKSGAYGDDSQIDDLRVTRQEVDRKNPRAVVAISRLGAS